MKYLVVVFLLLSLFSYGYEASDFGLYDYEEDVSWSCGTAIPLLDPHGLHTASGDNYIQARANSLGECLRYHALGCIPIPLTCSPV